MKTKSIAVVIVMFISLNIHAQKKTSSISKKASTSQTVTPVKTKEQILQWICDKIEENGSGGFEYTDDIQEVADIRTVNSCKYDNNNINIIIDCYSKSVIKGGGVFQDNIVSYNLKKTVTIPFDKLKNITLYILDKNKKNDYSTINFYVKGNSISLNNADAYRYENSSPLTFEELRPKQEHFVFSDYNIRFDFSKDPTMKDRMQKAIDDLKKFFNTKEEY